MNYRIMRASPTLMVEPFGAVPTSIVIAICRLAGWRPQDVARHTTPLEGRLVFFAREFPKIRAVFEAMYGCGMIQLYARGIEEAS